MVSLFTFISITGGSLLADMKTAAAVAPLIFVVAVSSTAVEAGALTQAGASLMISGAAISVFLMPLLAQVLTEPEQ